MRGGETVTVETVLALAMASMLAGTFLTGFARPIWWMLHPRGPDGRRPEMPGWYRWGMRIPGVLLLLAAAAVIAMSMTGTFIFAEP